MKNMIFVLVLVVVAVVGLGVYRGWFRFSSGSNGNDASVNLQIDKDKIHKDITK